VWVGSLAPSWICFSAIFLGEISWRHKVWSGRCCSPHPILNQDKVAGAFSDQEGRDNWGVAGVGRSEAESKGFGICWRPHRQGACQFPWYFFF
jgi:hypothetical protein